MIYITRLRRAWSIKRSLDPRGKLSHSSGVWSMAVRKIIEKKIVKTVSEADQLLLEGEQYYG